MGVALRCPGDTRARRRVAPESPWARRGQPEGPRAGPRANARSPTPVVGRRGRAARYLRDSSRVLQREADDDTSGTRSARRRAGFGSRSLHDCAVDDVAADGVTWRKTHGMSRQALLVKPESVKLTGHVPRLMVQDAWPTKGK